MLERMEEPMTTQQRQPDLLSIHKVVARISFSKSWIYAEMKGGRFPKPINTFGKNLWPSDAIDNWIAEQVKAGQQEKIAA